jgi:SAM-dependent methyltransferase
VCCGLGDYGARVQRERDHAGKSSRELVTEGNRLTRRYRHWCFLSGGGVLPNAEYYTGSSDATEPSSHSEHGRSRFWAPPYCYLVARRHGSDFVFMTQPSTTSYVIRGGEEGRARLRIIARALWPTTERLLLTAGIVPGMTCMDVGCGGGDVSLAMARLVGASGKVVGLDLDDTKLRLAREDAARDGLRNVEFRTSNVDQLDHEMEYDLVYARFLLTHLRDPADALIRIVRAAKLGGVIVVEDLDHSGVFSHPPCAALERHVTLYNQVVHLRGADPEIGPKLPGLFRQVGLRHPRVSHVQPVFADGEAKHVHQITLQSIRPALIAARLATSAEVDALTRALDDYVGDPETIMSFPRIFQVWARRT